MRYTLEIIVFVSGFVVLTFEILGSRILGPYFGTSIYVWSSIIGIILASLSIGYALGGKIADKYPRREVLGSILYGSAIAITIALLTKYPLLEFLRISGNDIRVSSVIAAIILFSPTSLLLGMVSPYAVRLALTGLKGSGETVGNFSAISTAGSILGTFATGFWLLPYFWVYSILASLSIIVILLSLLCSPQQQKWLKIATLMILIAIFTFGSRLNVNASIIDERDTLYSHIRILESMSPKGESMRTLNINVENHSTISLSSDRLVNEYTKYYHLVRYFKPDFQSALMLGGGAYSFPKDYLKRYPHATIDVAEIDSWVTELARQYFWLKDNPRLHIYHEDGRVFLNRNTTKYDVIFGDAFTSWYSVPYELTTKEAIQRQYESLSEDGIIILNIISSIDGDTGEFLRAEYATFREVFQDVRLYPVTNPDNPKLIQNIMLVARKKNTPLPATTDSEIQSMLVHEYKQSISKDMPILTDNFAPVDHYISKLLGAN